MSVPSATSSLETYVDSDENETPRPNCSNPFMKFSPPPPQTDRPRACDSPMNYYDDECEEEDGHWTAYQSLLRHLKPAADEGSEDYAYGPSSRYLSRHGWWKFDEITSLDDWTACVGIWVLACLVAIVTAGAAAVV
ncbi:hypothetical protein DE146DRAFT_791481 [Phaeosphaeria sp. MPI-PUGE-AT-0046c]|nr:hypothetical protein DE146DRAFT_791481 [Phaeosphaeria sp. MPI-PUGE-AT-0046c]